MDSQSQWINQLSGVVNESHVTAQVVGDDRELSVSTYYMHPNSNPSVYFTTDIGNYLSIP